MNRRITGCMVDAYSTGTQLADALKEAGVYLIHVQSTQKIPPGYSFPDGIFHEQHILSEDNIGSIVSNIKQKDADFVIAGSEPGTPLADLLCSKLGLPGNDPNSSQYRRRKSEMARALSKNNIQAVKQYEVLTAEDALKAADLIGTWPVVVKPDNAAGSEGVQICGSLSEVHQAFQRSFNKENCNCQINDKILVQEFLQGQQYMVNAVSIGGRHRITEIWKEYRKNIQGVGSLYDYEVIVPYSGEEQDQIVPYVNDVLDALGVREGASHTELMFTNRGPVLIESGARMQGGIYSPAMVAAIGESHVTHTKKRYLWPDRFITTINEKYNIVKYVMIVNFIADKGGKVIENNCQEYLSKLDSFFAIAKSPTVGTFIPRTVDLLTKPGHVYLLHTDMEQLMRDYNSIRELEKNNDLIVIQ